METFLGWAKYARANRVGNDSLGEDRSWLGLVWMSAASGAITFCRLSFFLVPKKGRVGKQAHPSLHTSSSPCFARTSRPSPHPHLRQEDKISSLFTGEKTSKTFSFPASSHRLPVVLCCGLLGLAGLPGAFLVVFGGDTYNYNTPFTTHLLIYSSIYTECTQWPLYYQTSVWTSSWGFWAPASSLPTSTWSPSFCFLPSHTLVSSHRHFALALIFLTNIFLFILAFLRPIWAIFKWIELEQILTNFN